MILREPRERERKCSRIKERRVAAIREETQTLPYNPEIMYSSMFKSSCSIDMQG